MVGENFCVVNVDSCVNNTMCCVCCFHYFDFPNVVGGSVCLIMQEVVRVGRNSGSSTASLRHSPATVSHIPDSRVIRAHFVAFDLFGKLAMMGVMLKGGEVVILIKQWGPLFGCFIDYVSIVLNYV